MDTEDVVTGGCLIGGCLAYVVYVLAFIAFWALVVFALVKYLGS